MFLPMRKGASLVPHTLMSVLYLESILQNLGHASTRTTLLYIGELGADKRRAPGVYSFDLTALDDIA
jgi:hypothetical protein